MANPVAGHYADIFRQAIMCHAVASVLTYNWPEKTDEKYLVENHTLPRVCRNFDMIYNWTKAHAVTT